MSLHAIFAPRAPQSVVILETHMWICHLEGRRLAEAGHRVTKVGSVDAAIAAMRTGADMAIVVGGPAVAAELRRAGCTQPIVLVAGPGYMAAIREAFQSGMHDLLTRTVKTYEALPRVVDRVLAELQAAHDVVAPGGANMARDRFAAVGAPARPARLSLV